MVPAVPARAGVFGGGVGGLGVRGDPIVGRSGGSAQPPPRLMRAHLDTANLRGHICAHTRLCPHVGTGMPACTSVQQALLHTHACVCRCLFAHAQLRAHLHAHIFPRVRAWRCVHASARARSVYMHQLTSTSAQPHRRLYRCVHLHTHLYMRISAHSHTSGTREHSQTYTHTSGIHACPQTHQHK